MHTHTQKNCKLFFAYTFSRAVDSGERKKKLDGGGALLLPTRNKIYLFDIICQQIKNIAVACVCVYENIFTNLFFFSSMLCRKKMVIFLKEFFSASERLLCTAAFARFVMRPTRRDVHGHITHFIFIF